MRSTRSRNLYRIDDALLRAGLISILVFVAALLLALVTGLAEGAPEGQDPGLAALARHAPLLTLAALCPVVLLTAGFQVRQREKQTVAIWKLLERNAEISVPGLIANSDFTRRDLVRAVKFLNNHGLDHYLWNREADTIQHARLQSSHLHVEKCDACGASIALDIPIGFHEIPRCPHCDDPVSAEGLEERRSEALEAQRDERRPVACEREASIASSREFSVVVFVILLVFCWPAAIIYAWWNWQGGF